MLSNPGMPHPCKKRKRQSQEAQILDLLKAEPRTARDILLFAGTMKAAQRIYDLRKRGYNIDTEMVKRRGAYVALYTLIAGCK